MKNFRIPAAICAATIVLTGGGAFAQEFSARDLPGSLTLISGPDGNVVAGADSGGLVLVGGASPERAQALVDFALDETGAQKLAGVVDTDWRPDVTGVNAVAAAAGAQITAHDSAYQWLKYGVENRADGLDYPARPAAELPTDVLLDDGTVLPFGEGEIRVGYLRQASTDSNLYAYFPGENVLVTGPAVRSDGWQMLDWWTGGYFGGLLDGYETLLQVADDDTVIVPASGPAISKAELQAQFDMYTEIYDRTATLLKSAMSPAEAVAAKPTGEYHPEWADADRFVELAFRSYYAHLRGNRRLGAIP